MKRLLLPILLAVLTTVSMPAHAADKITVMLD